MRRTAILILAIAAGIILAVPAGAATWLQQALDGFKQGPVVVVTGTEGTDSSTAGSLEALMHTGDDILIVMLPQAAAGEDTAQGFAGKIDKATDHNYVVAVSLGNGELPAVSTSLMPANQSADLMRHAFDVATSSSEAMGNFIQNVHQWETANPVPTRAPPTAPISHKATKSSAAGKFFGYALLGFVVLTLCAAVVLLFVLRGRRRVLAAGGSVDLDQTPQSVESLLRQLLGLRLQIKDENMRSQITKLAKDANSLFRKLRLLSASDVDPEADNLEGYLTRMIEVLEKYIEVQNNRDDYPNPDDWLSEGSDALDDFAGSIHRNLLRAGEQELLGYRVKARILSAQKYS